MGPSYRLILPEHPPGRDCWVEADQIVRTDDDVPFPRITAKVFALMVGMTDKELDILIYHDLKKQPSVKLRGRGRTRYIDLHSMEQLLLWMFRHKTNFRFDRLYLGLNQVRTMAYLYGYIDRHGYKLYPTLDDMMKYDQVSPRTFMSKEEARRIAKERRQNQRRKK